MNNKNSGLLTNLSFGTTTQPIITNEKRIYSSKDGIFYKKYQKLNAEINDAIYTIKKLKLPLFFYVNNLAWKMIEIKPVVGHMWPVGHGFNIPASDVLLKTKKSKCDIKKWEGQKYRTEFCSSWFCINFHKKCTFKNLCESSLKIMCASLFVCMLSSSDPKRSPSGFVSLSWFGRSPFLICSSPLSPDQSV